MDYFNKKEFIDWIMNLSGNKITNELKNTICDEFENIRDYPEFVLAIDFDRTICMSQYPETGPERPLAASVIRSLHEEGFGIVINTCREGYPLAKAMDWLKEHNVPYHYINCNFPHLIELYKADCRKISADMYIDDKGIETLPDWSEIYEIIHKKFKK